MRRLAPLIAVLLAAALAAVAATAASAAPLDRAVSSGLARGGGVNGGYVLDTTTGRVLASVRGDVPRIPASVEKLYTASGALLRFGAEGTLDTRVLGVGTLNAAGTWRGDLYLKGAGDPTFGSERYTRYAYGTGATVEELAEAVADVGIERVTGRVYGDESAFDKRRGGPASGWGYDIWIGSPLTGLLYNRGLAKEDGSARQTAPATFAAQRLTAALRAEGVRVAKAAGTGVAPASADELAAVASPPMSTLARLTLVPSDNLLAEMLLKAVGSRFGAGGSTPAGAGVVRDAVARFGAAPRIADGSGLSRANATSPRSVVRLLDGMRDVDGFREALPVAGRTGTLANRMRGTIAQDRCQAKTGTLSNVSALAGYCRTRNDHVVAFAFLFNSASMWAAKAAEDRLAVLVASQSPAGSSRAARRTGARRAATRTSSPARGTSPSRSGGATAAVAGAASAVR